jgi:hypothetical protein
MGSGELLKGAERNDSRRVDVVVCDVIMPFDMVEVYGLGYAVGLVEVF